MDSEFTFCGKRYVFLDKTEEELDLLEECPWDYVITPDGMYEAVREIGGECHAVPGTVQGGVHYHFKAR